MTLRPPVEPMLAQVAEAIPLTRLGAGVAYEQKFDGHRALLFTQPAPGGRVLIQTRRGSLVQDRFPALVAAAVEQLPPGLVLDGELLVWYPEAGARVGRPPAPPARPPSRSAPRPTSWRSTSSRSTALRR
ncbi:hypothetical protein [Streptomyces sp. NPDC051704]|uniref:ATP-dependent DNA ligase n=1 Tax=Streptomyces sp. NPDC051704 TaxID=3365671 RepID=UPI00378F46D5